MSGWFLESIEIEGFRGINHEDDPLCLRFKANAVCSISAPNGVGKSSIFDAISFALRGTIPKLDELPASEGAADYYINRFHGSGVGSVTITLLPEGGGSSVPITVRKHPDGSRTVSTPSGIDAEVMLQSLDREFVLLDHQTFQTFICEKDLDRGRSFSGLLGLKRYSELGQELQALANTRAFNNHFDTNSLDREAAAAESNLRRHARAVETTFQAMTETALSDHATEEAAREAAHGALAQIALLQPHCAGRPFDGIDFDAQHRLALTQARRPSAARPRCARAPALCALRSA
jgi:AAA domain